VNPNNISTVTDLIEIYNASSGVWTTTNLTNGRKDILMVSVQYDQIVFAGGILGNGQFSQEVNLYYFHEDTWTRLGPFACLGAAGGNTLTDIIIAGGLFGNVVR
jgi:hypothetical protein